MFIVNVGHVPGSNSLEQVVTATLRTVFPVVVRDRVSNGNSLLLASAAPLSKSRMVQASRTFPALVPTLASKVAGRLQRPIAGGTVYTDDRAPVEWLTDLSLVQYAAGNR